MNSSRKVYQLRSETDAKTLVRLSMPTPEWLDREYPYVPPPDDGGTLRELQFLISLLPEREENLEFIRQADEDFISLFVDLCEDIGAPVSREALDEITAEAAILITKLKWLYNRPRPFQVAQKYGVSFTQMPSETANTPAYPGGHTIQAYLIADYLSEIAPQHSKMFMDLASQISWSRALGGYHWPSDLIFGKSIYRSIVNENLPASIRVAAKYKKKREVPRTDGEGTTTIYEYSERQIANRHKEKAKRIEALRQKMSDLRAEARKDLNSEDPKTRLTALAVCLMDETYERVGNSGSADNGHFGVTTWRAEHVTLSPKKALIKYVGKSGVDHEKEVTQPKVLAALKKALEGKKKSDNLLCDGEDCTVAAKDVNEYLKAYDVTAKDIRGLHANEEMKRNLKKVRLEGGKLPSDKKEKEKLLKDEFKKALELSAEAVGHESATLRGQYLVPGMEDDYLKDGEILEKLDKKATLSQTEKEDREADRLVQQSPKIKPPRNDLRRNTPAEGEKDPDKEQDKKDRSNNYKDANSVRVALLWVEGKRKLITVRRKEDGKTVMVSEKTLKDKPGDYENIKDTEGDGEASPTETSDSGSSPKPKPKSTPESVREDLMGKYRDLGVPEAEITNALDGLKGEDTLDKDALSVERILRQKADKIDAAARKSDPTYDRENPLPAKGSTPSAEDSEKALDRAEKAVAKYRDMSKEDRASHLTKIEADLKSLEDAPDNDPRKMHLESIRKGIGIASALKDGMDAKGVGGAMARLIFAADSGKNLKKILSLGAPSGEGSEEGAVNQSRNDQDIMRDIFREVNDEDWVDMLPDDHPGRSFAELLGPDAGRYMSEQDREGVRQSLTDLMLGELEILEPEIEANIDPLSTRGEREEIARAARPTNKPKKADAKGIKSWVAEFLKSLAENAEKVKDFIGPGKAKGEPKQKVPKKLPALKSKKPKKFKRLNEPPTPESSPSPAKVASLHLSKTRILKTWTP